MDSEMIWMGIGLTFFGIGVYFVIRDWLHSKYGYHTQGTVVELMKQLENDQRGKQRYFYYPIIEFTTPEQQTKKMVMWVGSTIEPYSVGATLQIVYYQNEIYPSGTSWKVLYGAVTITGVVILLYQLVQ